jgi:S1-C subfamily serine protease
MPIMLYRRKLGLFVLLAANAASAMAQNPSAEQTDSSDSPSGLQFAAAIEQSLEAAIAKAEKSVVAIARVRRNRDSNDQQSADGRLTPFGFPFSTAGPDPTDPDFVPSEYGTGVVIDERGLILTNYHVLGNGGELESYEYYVTACDRKTRVARIKAADPRSDLAVLAVDGKGLTAIPLGDGGKLRKGQIVIALGNPYAIARDGQASASWGIVSNLQRKAGRTPEESTPSGKSTLHHLGTLIQTDARLNLGTSGGALLNLRGEMVGLTTALAAAAGYEQAAGYAIPVDETFRRIVDRLKNGEEPEYGFLGVQPENLRPEVSSPETHGVIVQDVVRGTPADRFGILRGDIITHVNGKPIYDFDSLVLQVCSHAAGEQVPLTVERGNRTMEITVPLAKYHVQGELIVTTPKPAWRGLRVEYWTAAVDFRAVRDDLDSITAAGCVIVSEVEKESLAEKSGLKPQMAITHVGNHRVTTPDDFRTAVAATTGPVTLRIATSIDTPATKFVVAAN